MLGPKKWEKIVGKTPPVLAGTLNMQWIRSLGMDIIGTQIPRMINLIFRYEAMTFFKNS